MGGWVCLWGPDNIELKGQHNGCLCWSFWGYPDPIWHLHQFLQNVCPNLGLQISISKLRLEPELKKKKNQQTINCFWLFPLSWPKAKNKSRFYAEFWKSVLNSLDVCVKMSNLMDGKLAAVNQLYLWRFLCPAWVWLCRNWCAYVVTRTVSCVMEDGVETYIKPDYHRCTWGQCPRVMWVPLFLFLQLIDFLNRISVFLLSSVPQGFFYTEFIHYRAALLCINRLMININI